ncbi:MAG: alpha-glucoside ABC transporter substrate-binding protein, partial [Pseudorhodobacter sp.]|nr:alpha-glucoside ABC transporter substrate-binding protein [Pseudorhodobacter sp.]
MKSRLFAGAAALALLSGAALAQDLKFAPGEDARFNWADFDALKAVDLKGQSLKIDGPWGGVDKDLFNSVVAYFTAATGASVEYVGGDGFEQRVMI